MALSMDEQRMLAEIERRLSAEDPRLAAKLSSFRRPGSAPRLRSPRGRIIGSLFTVVLVAVVSMMVYAMVPFRAHTPAHPGQSSASATSHETISKPAPQTSTSHSAPSTSTGQSAAPATTAQRTTATTVPKTSASQSAAAKSVHKTTATGTADSTRNRAPSGAHT